VSAIGAFTFVLHSHLPYARKAGRWPHGEEWLHEAAMETYVPLLDTLYDLREQGIPYRITIGITPILAEQLADKDVIDHFDQYLEDRIVAAQKDIVLFEQETPVDEQLVFLAGWYLKLFERIKHSFDVRFGRDILGAFRTLQDEGLIEITTCAATHGYLPLVSNDSTINAQLATGIRSYERFFGRPPTGIWLPECAYRPAYVTETGQKRPGIEHFLDERGIKVFFSETHTVTGGRAVGVAAGDVIGPYGDIRRRYVIPQSKTLETPESGSTTMFPYYVYDTTSYPESKRTDVSVIARNNRIGQQVWSAEWGYPGDFDYREFHRKAGSSGIQYWRITGAGVDLGHKELYHPDWAEYKIDQHAEHFAHLVGDQLRKFHDETGQYGLVSANYDTELFGHWWFEGVAWLGKVLTHLARMTDVELTTASRHVSLHPPTEVLNLPESSWGAGGTHFVWDNNDTHWMWAPIHEAEARMENLANHYDQPTDDERVVLAQAAREALLLESSDWPFLVTTGQAREYSIKRFSEHLERFNRLADSLEKDAPDVELAQELYELDKVFPDIDYRDFRTYAG
jgi:1,4-alpha-glucan branching enzyme